MADIKAGSHDLRELIWSKSQRVPVDQLDLFIGTTLLVNVPLLHSAYPSPFIGYWSEEYYFFFLILMAFFWLVLSEWGWERSCHDARVESEDTLQGSLSSSTMWLPRIKFRLSSWCQAILHTELAHWSPKSTSWQHDPQWPIKCGSITNEVIYVSRLIKTQKNVGYKNNSFN